MGAYMYSRRLLLLLFGLAPAASIEYFSSTGGMTQSDAKDWCAWNGGELAVIKSADENDDAQAACGSKTCWIGLEEDDDYSGEWYWADGTMASAIYTNWESGEPNNYGGQDEKFAMMNCCGTSASSTGKWYDAPGTYDEPVALCIDSGPLNSCSSNTDYTVVFDHVNNGGNIPSEDSIVAAGYRSNAYNYIGNAALNAMNISHAEMCLYESSSCHMNCVDITDYDYSLGSTVLSSMNTDVKKVIAMMVGQLDEVPGSAWCENWFPDEYDCANGCDCHNLDESLIYSRRIGSESGSCPSTSDCWSCSGYPGDAIENGDVIRKLGRASDGWKQWHVWGWGMHMDFYGSGLTSGSYGFDGDCDPPWDGYFIRAKVSGRGGKINHNITEDCDGHDGTIDDDGPIYGIVPQFVRAAVELYKTAKNLVNGLWNHIF